MNRFAKEKDRKDEARRRKNEAQSFRLGELTIRQLRELAQWRDESQADVVRSLVAKEHRRIAKRREEIVQRRLENQNGSSPHAV